MLNWIQDLGAPNLLGHAEPWLEPAPSWEPAALARLAGGLNSSNAPAFGADLLPGFDTLDNSGAWGGLFSWAQEAPASPGAAAPAAGGPLAPGELQKDKGAGDAQGSTGDWGPEDEKFLEEDIQKCQSGSPDSAGASSEFNNLFNDFGQTSEGNCASVAVIKAALDKYGTHVFRSINRAGDGFQVAQQDGKTVTITRAELQRAARAAKLKGKPSAAKSMAVLMYAVIGKNEGSVESLGKGADPMKIARDLGLGSKIKELSPEEAGQAREGAVAWSSSHAVYEANGKADHYGKAVQADGTDTNTGGGGASSNRRASNSNGPQAGEGGAPGGNSDGEGGKKEQRGEGPVPDSRSQGSHKLERAFVFL